MIKVFEMQDNKGVVYYPHSSAETTFLENGNNILNYIKNRTYKLVEDFGAIGDGLTDDSLALNLAMDWSRENNLPVYLSDKLYYVSSSVNIGNAIIRGMSNNPAYGDLLFLQKRDGSYLNGSPDWSYLFNYNLDLDWRTVVNEICYGCGIISDKNINILSFKNDERIDIEGIGVIGNHRAKLQNGICDEIPTRYTGNIHHIKNINVIGCGNNGINLYRGFEVSTVDNIRCEFNMGHGFFIGYTNGVDSATEYLNFNNCGFTNNRLDGIHFTYWRKDIVFNNCYLNGNGQYYVNDIDPLYGYDRKVPVNLKNANASIFFEKGNVESNNTNIGLTIKNCYGENSIKGVHIENVEGVGVVNSVIFENNIFYKGDIPTSAKGCCLYANINYISNWKVKGNYGNALDVLIFEKSPINGGNNEILDITTYPLKYTTELQSEKNITSEKRLYSNNVIFRDVESNGSNLIMSEIKSDFTSKAYSSTSNLVATYSLTAHWQSDNADNFGGYLLIVTKLPSGKYKMLTLALSSTQGFSSQPTMDDNGNLTIPTELYYMYTLSRIDTAKTN